MARVLEIVSQYIGFAVSLAVIFGGGAYTYLAVRGNQVKFLKEKIDQLEKENKTLRETNEALTKKMEELLTSMKDHNDRIVVLETQNAYLQELVTGRGTLEKVAKVVDLIHTDTTAIKAMLATPNQIQAKVSGKVTAKLSES